MIAAVVVMVVLACAPATLDRLKWVARWPHWLLLGCVHRNHQMPRAAFTVVVDPALAGKRRHALRDDRVVQ